MAVQEVKHVSFFIRFEISIRGPKIEICFESYDQNSVKKLGPLITYNRPTDRLFLLATNT